MSTNLPRFALSAEIQAYLDGLSPDPGPGHYFTGTELPNHTPPETFEGFTWFVVVCNPKCERRAQLGLRRAGYQTYLPQTKRWVVHARKKEGRENPLFPRYLFIGLRSDQDFYKLRGVDGVEGVVRDGFGVPARIPAPEDRPHPLARLLERELAGEFDFTRLPDLGPQYTPGETVRLTAGAFTDLQARVVSMLSKGRVEVLIDFLGRKVRLKAKHSSVVRV
ncbi:transcription termination/antitermination protein NusG [Microvirga sp. TS319]|uniref:transcription termination/antitermination protein NusG n=1 Tax=Microvirga sp. TS319 TaxID=3241165 RepID=UPI003519E33A